MIAGRHGPVFLDRALFAISILVLNAGLALVLVHITPPVSWLFGALIPISSPQASEVSVILDNPFIPLGRSH